MTRSSSDKYRAEMHFFDAGVAMGAYSNTAPELNVTVRPYLHRVPVRRFTPTRRHASEL